MVRNRRVTPQFPADMWSVYDRLRLGQDTTNNYAESMNRKINRHFGVEHPSFWRFIELLRSLFNNIETEYEAFVAGGTPTKSRKVYRERRKRILQILETEHTRTVEEILRGVATVYCDATLDSQAEEAVATGGIVALVDANGFDVEDEE